MGGNMLKRRIKVNKDKLYSIMLNKSCRLTVKDIADATNWNYDTIRHGLMIGELMPDTMQDIAKYLNVKVVDLQ